MASLPSKGACPTICRPLPYNLANAVYVSLNSKQGLKLACWPCSEMFPQKTNLCAWPDSGVDLKWIWIGHGYGDQSELIPVAFATAIQNSCEIIDLILPQITSNKLFDAGRLRDVFFAPISNLDSVPKNYKFIFWPRHRANKFWIAYLSPRLFPPLADVTVFGITML